MRIKCMPVIPKLSMTPTNHCVFFRHEMTKTLFLADFGLTLNQTLRKKYPSFNTLNHGSDWDFTKLLTAQVCLIPLKPRPLLTSSLAHSTIIFWLQVCLPMRYHYIDPSVGKVCSASFPCFIQVFMRYVWRFDLNCDSKSEVLGYDRISSQCLWTKCWEKTSKLERAEP